MSNSLKPIQIAFCFSAILLSLSIFAVMPSSAQDLTPVKLNDVFPGWNADASPTARTVGLDEPKESELVPEAVEAIEWLDKNFGRRVQRENLDWLASAFGDMKLDDDQLFSLGERAFGLKRNDLIQAIRDASERNENLEFYFGSVFTPDQQPTLVCLRDGELFVVPLADRYCDLTGLRPQDISTVERRQRFRNYQPMLTIGDLQSSNCETTEQGKLSLTLKFEANIDTDPGTDKLLFATEFWQEEKYVTSLIQTDSPKAGCEKMTSGTVNVEFADGELKPGKPVLVFVTAIQATDSHVDEFPGKTTRISNSLMRVFEVPEK